MRTDSVTSMRSTAPSTVTIAVTAATTTAASAPSFDRAGSQSAIFSSTISDDSNTKQPESYAGGTYAHHQERVNPFDKNNTPAAAAATPISAVTSSTAATSIQRSSGIASYSSKPMATTTDYSASVIQKQPSTTTVTAAGSFDRSSVPDYTRPTAVAPASSSSYTPKSYARTDSAFRRDFRSNSISAHSEYSHTKPTSGLSGSPLYSTLEEQPKPRPSAAAASGIAAMPASPATVSSQATGDGSQATRADAYTASTGKFTRSIGSFSDAELIFGGTTAVGGDNGSGGAGPGAERFSSSTDSSGVFRAGSVSDTPEHQRTGGAAPLTYKIYDGIQNHAFQDYDSAGSLATSREEDDEYDLK